MGLLKTLKTAFFGGSDNSTGVVDTPPVTTPREATNVPKSTITLSRSTESTINLSKKSLTISLAKKQVQKLVAEVKLCMDLSGSMGHLYRNGSVQKTLEKIIPLAMEFDDNGVMETYFFNRRIEEYEPISLKNIEGYVKNNGISANGGTSYAPSIKKIVDDCKNGNTSLPAYVLFVTDGENDDESDTVQALREASNHDVYFQFVGIGDSRFSFLERLDNLSGRKWDNAGFIKMNDMLSVDDETLYDELIKEFVEVYKTNRFKNGKISLIK